MDWIDYEIDQRAADLAPHVNRLDDETREPYWVAFHNAGDRYRNGKITVDEFRAVVRELTRDADGHEYESAPVDGKPSVRPGILRRIAEWLTCGITTAVCVAALLWVGLLLMGTAGVSTAGPAPEIHDRSVIMMGVGWSQRVSEGCAQGPATCDRVLREVNTDASAYGLRVYEDGSVTPH